ncbi:MAG: hypothetical protein ACHRXM_28830 [Isosphaerales bacterium]
MTRRRLTIARLMAIIILIALGLTAFKYALRRPSHPAILFKRFALVGRIDLNRDNQDDRQELKQIIEEAGGIVEFDFPPPDVGQQSGTLSNRIDWYVIDSRVPLREVRSSNSERVVAGRPDFQKRMSELLKEARLDGIRPMPIERLLSFLDNGTGSQIDSWTVTYWELANRLCNQCMHWRVRPESPAKRNRKLPIGCRLGVT